MLTSQQVQNFKNRGFLILRGFVDETTLSRWRDQFWAHTQADSSDPKTWPDNYVVEGFAVDPPFGKLPEMVSIVEQFGGDMFDGGGGSMLIKWPSDDHWVAPDEGHIDGYGPNGWSGGFVFGATTYLENVEHQGGGFYFWPESHLPVHDYFRNHPEHIDGSFRNRPDWEERGWKLFSDAGPKPPLEFIGTAGDVILWHCFLCHTGSSNVHSRPRLGVFSRWHRRDHNDIKYDVPEDVWKYWTV